MAEDKDFIQEAVNKGYAELLEKKFRNIEWKRQRRQAKINKKRQKRKEERKNRRKGRR